MNGEPNRNGIDTRSRQFRLNGTEGRSGLVASSMGHAVGKLHKNRILNCCSVSGFAARAWPVVLHTTNHKNAPQFSRIEAQRELKKMANTIRYNRFVGLVVLIKLLLLSCADLLRFYS